MAIAEKKTKCTRCGKIDTVDVVIKDLEGKVTCALCFRCTHKDAVGWADLRRKEGWINLNSTEEMAMRNRAEYGDKVMCPICFKDFTKNTKLHKYCSRECANRVKRATAKRGRKKKKALCQT